MTSKKVYVVGNSVHYASFITNVELVNKIEDADIVIFTGGEDVDPSLYGEKKDSSTYSNIARDKMEIAEFKKVNPNQLVIGICRGSQLMCVLNGGKLVQHVTNHGLYGTHSITNKTFDYEITSTHHQMQYPYNLEEKDYTLMYVSAPNRSDRYIGGGIDKTMLLKYGEPEIVLYHKENAPKCLAIQGHPEMMRKEAPVVKMLNNLILKLLNSIKDGD